MTRLQSGSESRPYVFSPKQTGFSLIEMMIVLAVLLIATGIGFITLQPALQQIRVSNAYNTTLMAMRQARETAIGQRRTYIVTFNNGAVPNSVTVSPASVTPGGLNVTYALPNDVRFTAIAGLPAIGPDNFGNGTTAIDFDQNVGGGVKTAIYFAPDGSAQDINNNINNGVVYIARPGQINSTKAITLWGVTGRLRGWQLNGATWRQQ